MASQNRSAGYCGYCQKGVTVVRPTGKGFFGSVKNAISNNEHSWVCSKCGNPASKGFVPPVEAHQFTGEEIPLTIDEQHLLDDLPTTPDLALDTRNEEGFETFSVATGTEAVCHICSTKIPFKPEQANAASNCPNCEETILLPDSKSETFLTSSPVIIKLQDDPGRPAISKSLCTLCQFEMTYPKKLAGKEVDCPSCSTHFQLP